MNRLFSLKGKIALITGSSGGLGLTFARGLAEAGAIVILNGRNGEKLERAADALRHAGHTVHTRAFDVTSEEKIQDAVSDIEATIGPIDILINNAGVQRRGSLETIERETFEEVLDTNLTAPFLMAKHVATRMMQRRRGKIINICSLMSELGRKTVGPYAASKGGLKMLIKRRPENAHPRHGSGLGRI